MQWTEDTISRLYELHELHVESLRRDVASVNRTLGAAEPAESRLEKLTRSEFQAILRNRDDAPEAVQLWIKRLIRGNEGAFPELQAAG